MSSASEGEVIGPLKNLIPAPCRAFWRDPADCMAVRNAPHGATSLRLVSVLARSGS